MPRKWNRLRPPLGWDSSLEGATCRCRRSHREVERSAWPVLRLLWVRRGLADIVWLVNSNDVPAANGRVLVVPIILVATIAAEHIARTMNTHQDGPLSRDFQRSIPMMFYQALDAVLPRFREIFAQFDITQPQWRVLRVLWDEDGQNLTSIAERTLIVPTVLVGIMDRLERDGRVERRRSKEDRRRVHIFLTESGHALRDDVAPLVDEAYVQLQAVLNAQEWRDLYSAIDKLIESDAAARATSE
ncbi:hypothetical protein MNBD_ACTINO02-2014 [hydrothermal vent metagenome]|uniref:HTH marR-type domain-containing protein n=1 Tax=hydrothermal vent metagenome TaxID=652676 RepID=A0A3B0ST52_9ZZZZ